MIGPSLDRIVRLQTIIQKMLASHSASAQEVHSVLGQMESLARLLPYGRAHKRFTTMACERSVVSGNPVLGLPYFTGSLVQTSSRAMAEQGFSSCYGSAGSSTTRLLSVHGCESGGLGRPSGRSLSFRPVVCSMENVLELRAVWLALKSFRQVISGCQVLLSTDNTTAAAYLNKGGGGGGGQVSNLVVHGNQAASVVCETTGVSDSQIHSRQTERTRRFALEEGADHSYRVDSPLGHSVSDFSLLGSPTHRSVCHETKQSTTDLCVSISRPLSLGSGCDVPVLGGNVSVCISSHPPSFEGAIENGERDLFGHAGKVTRAFQCCCLCWLLQQSNFLVSGIF